jgi:flavin reductase (DIM6/NTAB) family NADH-FMN oxidoreductase RutF
VNEADRRTVLRLFPYGLYAVTVRSGEQDHGITAAWVMQASFAPAMVVASVESESRALPMIRDAKAFALNVLATEQRDLAARLGGTSASGAPAKLAGTPAKAGPSPGRRCLRRRWAGWSVVSSPRCRRATIRWCSGKSSKQAPNVRAQP